MKKFKVYDLSETALCPYCSDFVDSDFVLPLGDDVCIVFCSACNGVFEVHFLENTVEIYTEVAPLGENCEI